MIPVVNLGGLYVAVPVKPSSGGNNAIATMAPDFPFDLARSHKMLMSLDSSGIK